MGVKLNASEEAIEMFSTSIFGTCCISLFPDDVEYALNTDADIPASEPFIFPEKCPFCGSPLLDIKEVYPGRVICRTCGNPVNAKGRW